MESNCVNKISKTSIDVNLNDQTNTRRIKQPKWFITLIIFFILNVAAILSVLTMIKRDYESELPANNPEKAIKFICKRTRYYETCFKYMSNSLYKSSKINSSQVFSISLRTAIDELQKVTHSLKSQSTASQSNYLYLNNSLSKLNSYLGIDEEKNLTARMTMRSEMLDWLHTERPKIAECLYSLEYDKGLNKENVNNCLMILANMKSISEMLDPPIGSYFSLSAIRSSGKSIVDLLFSDWQFVDLLCIFGVQYVFLLILFCRLLRVW